MNCPHCGCNLEVSLKLVSGPVTLPDGFTSTSRKPASPPVDGDELAALLEVINMSSLDGKSLEFVTQTKERFAQYGERTRMSDKQMKWLRELAAPESADTW